ncbi:MAG: tRNA (N6-threonylcarbamoyladenosine(37)-N6)-methyltransferase TrmO [Chloroflexota bacterium]
MNRNIPGMLLSPIGVVRNEARTLGDRVWEDVVSGLVIRDEFARGLKGIGSFSHLMVLYWMHLLEPGGRSVLEVHPRRKRELPLVGVFATRSPVRPNPVGVTVVRLLKQEGNVLTVKGLDAVDGTPVIDIKPYLPAGDCVKDATVAPWVALAQG